MKRRTFLQWAGASPAAMLAGPAMAGAAEDDGVDGIDMDALSSRNRNRSTVVCRHGMVCTSQPLASVAGLDVLKAGGNAIDAAIAANAMLGLVEPPSCGMGGDLFAMVWIEADRKLYGLNASGRSAYGFDLKVADALGLRSIPGEHPLSWSVPGCVSGWGALSDRFGAKSLSDALQPAIGYAREGFPLSPLISRAFGFDSEKYATLAEVFQPDGVALKYGDIFANPKLAGTLELIASEGWRAYYAGEPADRIVAHSRANGGKLEKRDFEDHTVTWVDPVSTGYRGYDVWELPPNGQGIAALQMLNMLEEFDIGSLEPNGADHAHLFVEAKKLAYEDRAKYYADPEFADVPVAWLVSKEYGKERARLIDPKRASTEVGHGDPTLDSDTIYLCAADDAGNMISFIQSNYAGWGSGIVPSGLGFPIQNRGQSFSLDPNHRNKLEAHKRPFHTIIPAFMTRDEKPVWAFGVMGGDFQPQGHAQVVMNTVDFGMSPQQAGDQPRIEHVGSSTPTGGVMKKGGSVRFEHGISEDVKREMERRGHRVSENAGAYGGYQSIGREEGPRRYFGGSDPRKDGLAIGY